MPESNYPRVPRMATTTSIPCRGMRSARARTATSGGMVLQMHRSNGKVPTVTAIFFLFFFFLYKLLLLTHHS
jgi:hypothetical protein